MTTAIILAVASIAAALAAPAYIWWLDRKARQHYVQLHPRIGMERKERP